MSADGRSSASSKSSWAKMLAVLAQKKLIGHAGDVIANHNVARFGLLEFFMRGRHGAWRRKIMREEFFEATNGAVAVLGDSWMIVNVGEQEALERRVMRRGCAA